MSLRTASSWCISRVTQRVTLFMAEWSSHTHVSNDWVMAQSSWMTESCHPIVVALMSESWLEGLSRFECISRVTLILRDWVVSLKTHVSKDWVILNESWHSRVVSLMTEWLSHVSNYWVMSSKTASFECMTCVISLMFWITDSRHSRFTSSMTFFLMGTAALYRVCSTGLRET